MQTFSIAGFRRCGLFPDGSQVTKMASLLKAFRPLAIVAAAIVLILLLEHVVHVGGSRELLRLFEEESGIAIPKSGKIVHSEWTWMQSNHVRAIIEVGNAEEAGGLEKTITDKKENMLKILDQEDREYTLGMYRRDILGEKGLFHNVQSKPSPTSPFCGALGYEDATNRPSKWAVALDNGTLWIWYSRQGY